MCLPHVVVPLPHSMLAMGRCNLFKKVWQETLKLSRGHLQALDAMTIDWMSSPKTNLPFDSEATYVVRSKERRACSATLQHYPKIGSFKELPPGISDGLWSPFFPKKGTIKMRGCVDFRKTNSTSSMSTRR